MAILETIQAELPVWGNLVTRPFIGGGNECLGELRGPMKMNLAFVIRKRGYAYNHCRKVFVFLERGRVTVNTSI